MFGVAVVAGYANRDRIRLKIASVYATVPPKAAQPAAALGRNAGAVSGDAAWALSALPECFAQLSKSTSPSLGYVLAQLPSGAVMVRPPQRLRYADCTLDVRDDVIYVRRGEDHLRVPPPARLYVGAAPDRVALLRGGRNGYDLRIYRTVTPEKR